MPKTILGWLAVLVAALAMFWGGYSLGRVQNLGALASYYRDADVSRYTLTRAGTTVHFEKAGGDGKPYISTQDGVDLLDLSDWDNNSRITVDGTPFDLVRIYPTSSVDYDQYRVAESLQGDGWQLQREIVLQPDGSVTIDHSFVARKPIKRVDLAVAYVHHYYVDLKVDETGASVAVNSLTLAQAEAGTKAPATYSIRVTPAGTPGPTFWMGDTGIYGPGSFLARYFAQDPKQDLRTELGKELIRIQQIKST